MPSNFRTYEAQSRLLAAVIASNPSMKLDYKAIAQHYGSDGSQSAIEHRFRPIKKMASVIRKAVSEGMDAKQFSSNFSLSDKEIFKYYGESTAQGIEFQFRSIKKEAKALRDAVDKGASPLTTRKNVPSGTNAAARKRKTPAPAVPVTPANAAAGSSSTPETVVPPRRPAKRSRATVSDFVSNDDDDDALASDVDYEQLDLTPISTPSHRTGQSIIGMAASAVPITPSTTMAAPPTAYFTDTTTATPALSNGVSPADNNSPDNDQVFHTAVQQPRQQSMPFYSNNHNTVTIDDDDDVVNNTNSVDDDDDLYIIDTPSKMPKLESTPAPPPAPASTATLSSMGSFGTWNASGQNTQNSHVQSQSQFVFDANGSSWGSLGFFPAPADPMASFAGTASFYDNDDAI
ncbi:hypothetical protein SEUCBS139899_010574 [Sporothrix eucalyptigena]|uniref:Uncharacterized protein n=1 Tax=Sporothrix eucalyptigena TaxID=1812306 RepID=A0ABP0C8I2_9PEZI